MAAVLAVNGCAEVENLLQFCNISKERIRVEEQKEFTSPKEPTLTFSSGETVTGVRTVGAYLSRISTQKLLGGSALERALVDQWMEYCQSHLESSLQDGTLTKGALRYLDKSLSRTVYLVGCQLTLADIMLYYALHPLMLELSIQEKEQFINLSRWFNQVQYYPGVRQYLPEVSFLRNMLYS